MDLKKSENFYLKQLFWSLYLKNSNKNGSKVKNYYHFIKKMIFELEGGQNDQGFLLFEGNSLTEKQNSKDPSPIKNSKKKSFYVKF